MKKAITAPVLVLLVVVGSNRNAVADCDAGPQYVIEIRGNSVAVCLSGSNTSQCPEAGPMLRENTNTGEVVALYSLCVEADWNSTCYLDECVPHGNYRYGLETPFECYEPSCFPIPFYEEFTVPSEPPQNCSLSKGNTGPTPYAKPTPWAASKDGYVCQTDYSDGGGDSGLGGGNSGCSVTSSGSRVALSVNAIAFLLGLLLLARRRRS